MSSKILEHSIFYAKGLCHYFEQNGSNRLLTEQNLAISNLHFLLQNFEVG